MPATLEKGFRPVPPNRGSKRLAPRAAPNFEERQLRKEAVARAKIKVPRTRQEYARMLLLPLMAAVEQVKDGDPEAMVNCYRMGRLVGQVLGFIKPPRVLGCGERGRPRRPEKIDPAIYFPGMPLTLPELARHCQECVESEEANLNGK